MVLFRKLQTSEQYAGTEVLIRSNEESEPRELADLLAYLMKNVGWKARIIAEAQTAISSVSIKNGLTIYARHPMADMAACRSGGPATPEGRAWVAANALGAFLRAHDVLNFRWMIYPNVWEDLPNCTYDPPADAVVVLVGPRPAFVESLTMKEPSVVVSITAEFAGEIFFSSVARARLPPKDAPALSSAEACRAAERLHSAARSPAKQSTPGGRRPKSGRSRTRVSRL